ncbi:ABC transporter substrate-binding protein [Gordonia sp. PDNC005]|uniref:ABC transporter substrate-binding protein n=1 Tax=unclassified Gordonia (in: high G+C Gram-positive bacteria) TaxID=2657482 RepID=UPI001966C7EA|nr:ABC transporter substrate-binding protein [Gordonia sp. PDNC005]QRY64392.1 ABC transporter substrate-binding protein [Gordonia sp. PDNC005]
MKVSITTRRVLAAFATATAVVAISACGSTDDGGSEGASGSVQVQTANGPVTINGTPEKIVTIGSQWTETVVALGQQPVAYYDAVKATTGTVAPWLAGKVGDGREIDIKKDIVTQIADLDPDVIFTQGSITDAPTLKKLQDTGVPVIAAVGKQQVDSWQDLLAAAGTALGRTDEAAEVKTSIDDKIASIKSANPKLAGKTYSFAAFQSPTMITLLADNNDGAAALFTELGLSFPQAQLDRAKAEGTPRFQVSPENVQILDSDLLVIAAVSDELKNTLQNLPSYKSLNSVRNGAVAWTSYVDIFGLNTPSALSIPALLDKLSPAFAAVK